MVEINNQRKAFLDMLAWSEGTDNGRQKTQKSWIADVIVGGELFLIHRSPSQTCHAKPKTQINRRRTLPASFPLVGYYRKQLGLKDFSRKVRTLWHCSRLRSVALYLWLIVVISVGNRPLQQYLGFHCRALVMVSSSIRLTAWLQNSKKRAEQSEVDVWTGIAAVSPLRSHAHRYACNGLLIITVITPLPTKPSATKMPENWSWRTRRILTCRCVSVMLLRSMQNTRRCTGTKQWPANWCAAGRRRLHQSSLSVELVREATTASGVDNAASPTGRHRWTGLFHPQRGADHCAKQLEGTQKYINEQCR